MEKSELVSTLKLFSAGERKQFDLFLKSPYCTGVPDTQHEQALAACLFGALDDPAGTAGRFDNEVVYRQVYPGRDYKAQTLSNLASSVLKLARRFIAAEIEQQMGRPERENSNIIQYLTGKGAVELCEKYITRLERSQNPESARDDLDYYLGWRSEQAISRFQGNNNRLTDDYNLQTSLVALQKFYLAEYLNALSSLFNQNRMTPLLTPEQRQTYLDDLERWRDLPFFHGPLVQLYLKVLQFLHLDDPEAEKVFRDFMTRMEEFEAQLSPYHLARMEAFAYNFCVRRFTKMEYKDVVFDLFRRWIAPGRLNANIMVTANDCVSYVTTALAGGQADWAEQFLEKYRHRIKGAQASEAYYLFGKALLLFHRDKFEEALDIVLRLNFQEMQYKYMSKTLEIKLFYETGSDLLDSKLNNLNVALSRENRMPPEKIKRYTQFVHFTQRIDRWRHHPDSDLKWLDKIAEDIKNAQNTVEFTWLTKKVRQLRGE